MAWIPAIASLASTVVKGQGDEAARADAANQRRKWDQLANYLKPEDLQIALERAQMSNYGPAVLQQTPTMGPSAFQGVAADADLQKLQTQNNAQLQEVTKSGFTPEMMAAYNKMLNRNNANLQAQMQGVMQNQAARGMGSSGSALALQGQAAQGALNNESQTTEDIAGQGFQNKLAAMNQLGGLTNAQQQQLINLGLGRAQGIQNQEQFGTRLAADIASGNVGRQQQQANLQTGARNEFNRFNTDIANKQLWQNQIGAKTTVADNMARALSGQSGITTAMLDQGTKSADAMASGAGNMAAYGLGAATGTDVTPYIDSLNKKDKK